MGSERSFARENPKVVTSKVEAQDERSVKVSHPPSPDNLMHIIVMQWCSKRIIRHPVGSSPAPSDKPRHKGPTQDRRDQHGT